MSMKDWTDKAKAAYIVRLELMQEAKKQTIDTLPAFLDKLANMDHNYSSICIAVAAAAIGAACALDKTPNGGITGYQAQIIFWEFYKGWLGDLENQEYMKLLKYKDMLYPAYQSRFEKYISPEVWQFLQEDAANELKKAEENRGKFVDKDVIQHWQSIVDGVVPFGYTIKEI